MGFLIFDGAGGNAIPDGEAHLYRRVGEGLAAGIPGDGLVGDALRDLGENCSRNQAE